MAKADASGSATLEVVLKDNGGAANGGRDTSAPQRFSITVDAVNDAPSFTKGPDQTVLEDGGPQSVPNWATAISTGPANEASQTKTFTVTLVSTTNPDLFAVPPAVAPDGRLSYTPKADASGSATFDVVLKDNDGTANGGQDASVAQAFTISVTPVNDPPVLTSDDTLPLSYTENDPLTPVSPTLQGNDVDDASQESAIVRIVGNYQSGEDILAVAGSLPAGITAAPFDPAQASLRFLGTASLADYQAALRLVAYQNTSDNPNVLARTVRFLVKDGEADGNPVEREIQITAVNDPPAVTILKITDDAGREIGPNDNVFVGQKITLTGSFTDPDVPDSHNATVLWGDGNVTAREPVSPGAIFTADHTYAGVPASDLEFTVRLTVSDSAPEPGSDERKIKVVDASSGPTDAAGDLANLLTQLSPSAAQAVQKAIDILIGQNGGAANNGAIDMLDQGNAGAALVKIRQAIQELQAAVLADPSREQALTEAQRLLALAAASIVTDVLYAAEKVASKHADFQRIKDARAPIESGRTPLATGDFLGAIDRFQSALSVLQPAAPKKAGLSADHYTLFVRTNPVEGDARSIRLLISGSPGTEIELEQSNDLQSWSRSEKLRTPYTGVSELTVLKRVESVSEFFRVKHGRVELE